MTEAIDQKLQLVIDKQEIRDLSGTYMRGLDRLQKALVLSVFHDDARTDYGFFKGSAADFAEFAIGTLKDHHANHHFIGQTNIDVEGDIAFGEVYFQAFHRIVEDREEKDLFISGRYVDRYEKRNGVWKISFRAELADWARTDPATDVFMKNTPDALFGARGDDDLSSQRERLRTL